MAAPSLYRRPLPTPVFIFSNNGVTPPEEWRYRLHVYPTESLRADATLHLHLKANARGYRASAPCPVPDGEAISFVSIALRDKL